MKPTIAFLLIVFLSLNCSQTFPSTRQVGSNWEIMPNDHLKSYGEECSILVYRDMNVLRDVISIEPSLESVFNTAEKLNDHKATKAIVNITFTRQEDTNTMVLLTADYRLLKDKEMIEDKSLKDDLTAALNDLDVELLKSFRPRSQYSFGVILKRK